MKKYTVLMAAGFLSLTSQLSYAQSTTPKIQDADCKAAFTLSSAYNSCNVTSAYVVGDSSCQINATCAGSDGTLSHPNSITLPYSSVPSLNNCKGYLSTSSC